MSAVLMLLRVNRAALRSWLGLALLLAVVGGGVLAAGAGARRTDTAYPRFLQASNASDVLVTGLYSGGPQQDEASRKLLDQLKNQPQVTAMGRGFYLIMAVSLASGKHLGFNEVSPVGLGDASLGRTVDRFKVLDGSLADPDRADEVTITFPLADQYHLHVGDRLTVRPLRAQDIQAASASGAVNPDVYNWAKGTQRTVRIAGIVASPVGYDFPPLPPRNGGGLYFTPAFLRQGGSDISAYAALAFKLRHGAADLAGFERTAEQLAGGQQLSVLTAKDHEAVVESTLHLQALGLGLLAALGAMVLVLVLGQGAVRRIALDAADHPGLSALGVTRGQLWAVEMARAGIAALAGAAGAVLVATALSPLTPIGVAGLAEPNPGLAFDAAILVGGAAALALLLLLMAVLPAWQAAGARDGRESAARQRGSRFAELLRGAGLPAAAVAGARFALEPGRGQRAVPVRTAVAACAIAVATVAGALSFSASLDHLVSTPRLYGWTWDADVTGLLNADNAGRNLAAAPAVAAVAQGTTGDVSVDGNRVAGLAMEPVKGSIAPAMVSGRVPHSDDEIVLGTQTDTAAAIGQEVTLQVGDRSRHMRVVGRAVIPILSDTSRLGVGAWLTYGGLAKLLGAANTPPVDTFLVSFRGDPQAGYRSLLPIYGVDGITLPQSPSGLVDFGVSELPLVLGGVLAAGAIATLAHAVLTSVRRRRRDLAVLKTLGFTRRQVALAVAWQATVIATLAIAVGVPLGAAAGRWAWSWFAGQQGMVSEPVVPVGWTLLLLPAALLLANLVAAIPGRYAARTSPAMVLRAE